MKILIPVAAALTLSILCARADQAWGQNPYQSPFVRPMPQQSYIYRPPTVSPYIGLLRRGSGIGMNYFSLVRPEIQTNNNLQRQQGEQDRLAQETMRLQQQQQQQALDPYTQPGADRITGTSRGMPPTGHGTSLLNLQGRFMTR